MWGWLFGLLMFAAGLVALVAGMFLAYWWTEPRGTWETQVREPRSEAVPLLVSIGLTLAWIPWMVVAVVVAVVGFAVMFLDIVMWAAS